jgi:AcrR family transcriptional regulator
MNSTNEKAGAMRQPPGRSRRRGGGERKPREERWSELIEVATDVFYAKGYDAASLQDIADRLGMLKGSLYYYIQSKEDLLYDVIRTVHEEGLANIESLAASDGDPLERLRRVIIGHIDHECRNLTKTAVFLHELQALSPERQAEIIGDEHAYRRVFVDLIEAGQQAGEIRPEMNSKLAALSVLGSINWVYRWFKPGGEFSSHQIGEQFADQALRGLATADALARILPPPVTPSSAGPSRPAGKSPARTSPARTSPARTSPAKASPARTAAAKPAGNRAKTA